MGRALIVSAGASSNEYISARLTELGYARPIIVPSAAEARRRMLESDFELIVVNSPLPDEFGHELCAEQPPQQAERGVGHAVGAAFARFLVVVKHTAAHIVHNAVKTIRHNKTAGYFDIRPHNHQQRCGKHIVCMELAAVSKTFCRNFHRIASVYGVK